MLNTKDLNYIIEAHGRFALNVDKTVRYWDKKTPYSIHPIWCAMTILHETSLPEELRRDGFQALLYHDVLEDSQLKLPDWLSERVQTLVEDMTFESSQQEMIEIWNKPDDVRLVKLYDKTSNLMDGRWMNEEKRKRYTEYTSRLCDDVEKNYGELNITRIARAII